MENLCGKTVTTRFDCDRMFSDPDLFQAARPWSHHGWCLHGLASEPSLSVADHAKRDRSWVGLWCWEGPSGPSQRVNVSMYGHA